jgi:outer membrane biosynthesis protein TonB
MFDMRRLIPITVLVCLCFCVTSWTQSKPKTAKVKTKIVSLGCDHCGTKAIFMPKPLYPATARAVRAAGPVAVSIKIDKKDYVYWARAVSGHIFLRAAAEKAAVGSRFEPTIVKGKAIRVTETIIYKFVLD